MVKNGSVVGYKAERVVLMELGSASMSNNKQKC